jgi:hypothetical protein
MSSSSKRSASRRAPLAALAAALGLSAAAASLASADAIDPTLPRTLTVGAPRGFAPAERLDGRRTGRSPSALPDAPSELWRRNLSGGLDVAPVVDARGEVIAALTSPEVVRLAPDGRELWRTRIGGSAAIAAPVLTSDGTAVVLTAAGLAIALRPGGAIRWAAPLGLRGTREADAAPLALDDGGLVVAGGRTLVEVDADGAVRARASLDERALGGLVAGPDGALVTTESGVVYAWRPPGAPRRLGSFGGVPRRGAALADRRTVVAVVDGKVLVALDLVTGTTHVLASAPAGALLDGPPAVSPSGLALVSITSGLVVGVDAAGAERLRAAVDRTLAVPDGGALASFFGPVEPKPSAPLVVDAAGRVAFARPGGRAGIVHPDATVTLATDRACGTPIAISPAGERRFLLACRDGVVWMLGE